METELAKPSGLSVIIRLANPTFVVLAVGLPGVAVICAMTLRSLVILDYVHVMTGALGTGIDLFRGFVLGPVLGGWTLMSEPQCSGVSHRRRPFSCRSWPSLR
jgi:hypothetical protein